jgi:hypothetical protein
MRASSGLFPMLGLEPQLGRTFTPAEDAPGHDVVVISDGLWRRRYGGTPDVIGKVTRVNGTPVVTFPLLGGEVATLALQEGASGEESQRRAKRRGVMLLDELDQLKMGLLTGGVPESTLQHLTNLVNSQRDEVMDPQLRAVLDEIDLRVQVELAKFSRK